MQVLKLTAALNICSSFITDCPKGICPEYIEMSSKKINYHNFHILGGNLYIAGYTYDHKCITNHSASLGLMQTETSALECKILSVNQYYIPTLMNIANSRWTLKHLSIPAIDIHFKVNVG